MKLGFRTWILIIVLIMSLMAIRPNFESGVLVKSVERNSSLFNEGLRQGDIIKSINDIEIKDLNQYREVIESNYDDSSKEIKKINIITKKGDYTAFIKGEPNITVSMVPKTRIKTGLDISGGARALVQPDVKINDDQLSDLIEISSNRFNIFGLSDVQIKGVTDLSGEKFMLIEVAGASPSDLEELIAQQGKFEAKIGNRSVFQGGNNDIADVCRNDATCSGISSCLPSSETGGYVCQFNFVLYLTSEAAKRHADVTSQVPIDPSGQYLAEKLYLYIDGNEVDSLFVGIDLKGQETTEISIRGPGYGDTEEMALNDAKANMKKLQTVLITGSLPYKLHIVKLDTISPNLGAQFIKAIFIAVITSLVLVSIIIFIRYRRIKASLALLFTSFSELIIILGVAALINWNLDLPSIAGILTTIGTGVDSQIVILDEARRGAASSLKDKIKRALFIIFASYATALAALLPLLYAGAGLFKGFAVTTIIGITAGVFIARPAFAEIIRKIEE